MAMLDLKRKLAILADAAKYDASCASCGGIKRDSKASKGIGSTEGAGICHAYAPDGRCISLLKILLTNFCVFDCAYCINRAPATSARARFTRRGGRRPHARLLPAQLHRGPVPLLGHHPLARLHDGAAGARSRAALREEHGFRGYIHLKTIPEAEPELIDEAGRYADRLSINIELPTEASLSGLRPRRSGATIARRMGRPAAAHRGGRRPSAGKRRRRASRRPARHADDRRRRRGATTRHPRHQQRALYAGYRLRRVYYSAFSPIPDASSGAAARSAPPLMREHRLYQADWLMRFYGFARRRDRRAGADGMLDLAIDPKLAWALRHRERFPVDVNTRRRASCCCACRASACARSTGSLGARRSRARCGSTTSPRLTASAEARLQPFIVTADWRPARRSTSADLRERACAPQPRRS